MRTIFIKSSSCFKMRQNLKWTPGNFATVLTIVGPDKRFSLSWESVRKYTEYAKYAKFSLTQQDVDVEMTSTNTTDNRTTQACWYFISPLLPLKISGTLNYHCRHARYSTATNNATMYYLRNTIMIQNSSLKLSKNHKVICYVKGEISALGFPHYFKWWRIWSPTYLTLKCQITSTFVLFRMIERGFSRYFWTQSRIFSPTFQLIHI